MRAYARRSVLDASLEQRDTGCGARGCDRLNRYVNSSAGMAIGLISVYAVVGETSGGGFNAHVLMAALAGALAFLIGGIGLVGLRQPASQGAERGTERRPREKATI